MVVAAVDADLPTAVVVVDVGHPMAVVEADKLDSK